MGLHWSESELEAHLARKTGAVRPYSDGALRFTLPVAPSVNHAYANAAKGRVLTEAGRKFKAYAKREAEAQVVIQGWKYEKGQRIALSLSLVFPKGRHDLSNIVKLSEDSIAEALGFDDSVVDRLIVERLGVDPENPHCVVKVEILK